ncbi:MAG: hypothetical protein ACO329_08900 [Steroidobacteraceae bacterium]
MLAFRAEGRESVVDAEVVELAARKDHTMIIGSWIIVLLVAAIIWVFR